MLSYLHSAKILALCLAATFILPLIRIGLGTDLASDGLSQLRFEQGPQARGLRFLTWIDQPALNENSDLIIEIDGKPIEAWAKELLSFSPQRQPSSAAQIHTYSILREAGPPMPAVVRYVNYPQAFGQYNWRMRWSVPAMMLVFMLVGCWVYLQRPHEPTAHAFLIFACSSTLYQAFQPMLRQASDITHVGLFWFGQITALCAGFTIMGGLIHLALTLPAKMITSTHFVQSTRLLVIYGLPILIFSGLQFVRFLSNTEPFQFFYLWQQDWQLFQTLCYGVALLMLIWRAISLKHPLHKRAIRTILVGGILIFAFLLASEKGLLLLGLPPLFDDNTRRFASILFPVLIAFSIVQNHLFYIEWGLGKAVIYFATVGLVLLFSSLSTVVITTFISQYLSINVSVILTFIFLLLTQPVIKQLSLILDKFIYGYRNTPYQLSYLIDTSISADLAPEQALAAIAALIQDHFRLAFVSIAMNAQKQVNSTTHPVFVQAGESAATPITVFEIQYRNLIFGQLVLQSHNDEDISHNINAALRPILQELGGIMYAIRTSTELKDSHQHIREKDANSLRLQRILHDSLGADLAGLALTVESTAKVLQPDKPLQTQILNEVAHNLQIKAQEIKALARGDMETRPVALAQYGLEGAITRYVNTRLPALDKSVHYNNLAKNLNATLEDQLYLITLEAVNNVAQHAYATSCSVHIEFLAAKQTLILQIVDNGLGIPLNPKLSTGLRSMQQRAVEIGGEFSIENNTPSGTRLKVVVNLAGFKNQ